MAINIRLGQDGGYVLAPYIPAGGYIEPPNPQKGYVFIADPGEGGT